MLEARDLVKTYSRIPAVEGVSFTLAPGQVLGFLGPNGAGKSTTVKLVTGLLEPTSGELLYQGQPIRRDLVAHKRRLGYVPEEARLYTHLSGLEYLQLIGRLRGMPRQELDRRALEFLRLLGLWESRYSLLSSYSKGMRQKILLSAALLHDPEILVLDEPFSGLDVTAAMVLRMLIKSLARQGKLIFYSSHVLEVVEKVCDTVVILRKGRVVAHDSVDRLRSLMALPSLEDVFSQLALQEDPTLVAESLVQAMRA